MFKPTIFPNCYSKAVVFVLILLIANVAFAFSEDKYQANYQIHFSEESRNMATVSATLVLHENVVKMVSWGHPWLTHGWATFVDTLEITDEAGKPLEYELVEKEGWGKWKVNAKNGTTIRLSYNVHFNHSDYDWTEAGGIDSRPEVTDRAHFLVTKALFVYSPGVKDAKVTFNIPKTWKIGTNWEENGTNSYYVDSWINLVNNSLVVGDFYHVRIPYDNMNLIMAIDKVLEEHSDSFVDLLKLQLVEFNRIFGGSDKRNYMVSIREADVDDGEAFHDSFNQVITANRIDDRFIVWGNTMAHELFHYWNGNFFLVGEDPESLYWFTEGFTEYYASLSLLRTGMIDEELYLKKLEKYISRYIVAKSMWPVESTSLVNAGKEKHKNWLLLYGGGATIALILDFEIRKATENRKNLDDVMFELKNRFGERGLKITTKDVENMVSEISGEDYHLFFDKYIYGTEKIDVESYLKESGLIMDSFADAVYLSKEMDAKPLLNRSYGKRP